ncbi:hypothetical protein U1Q18_025168 [Sarracenia purpurea var. burkii]
MVVLVAHIQRLKGLSPIKVDSILKKKSHVVKDPIIAVEVTESKAVISIVQPVSEGENDRETEDGDNSGEDEDEKDGSNEMDSTRDLPKISEKEGALDEEEEKWDNTGDDGNYSLEGTMMIQLKIDEVLENKRGDDSHLGEITRGTESAQNVLDKMPTPTSWANLECPQLYYVEFLDLFGDAQSIKKVDNRHAKLFLPHKSTPETKKRNAEDILVSDKIKLAKPYSGIPTFAPYVMGAYPSAQNQWPTVYGS